MIPKPVHEWVDDLLGRKEYHRYMELETRKRRISGQLFTIVNIICALGYIVWCFSVANWKLWYIFIPFIATEIGFFLLFFLWANLLWNKRYHKPTGLDLPSDTNVDIFIPCCSEPLDILERTIRAAVSIMYQRKNVCILDDGGKDSIKELAERYSCTYIRRPTHEHRKAGNLNYGLKHTNGELILALDADQVAQPELIDRIIGYFSLPHVAFVQTAQSFTLPPNDPWGNADSVFYKVMQSGKDYDNAAISCGSGVMYRRKALDEIGGFSEWNFVEDLHTSMRLHERQWKSVYHGVAYTRGTAPIDAVSNLKQRWQWAVDSLRMFFWDNPLTHPGLSIYQKLQYLHFGYNYIVFGLLLPIFFIIPIWALFTHRFMLDAPLWMYVVARLPYFIVYIVTNQLLTDKVHSFKSFQVQAGLFGAYFDAIFTALKARKRLPTYTVTSKVALRQGYLSRLGCAFPHLVFSVLALAAIVWGAITIKNDPWFLGINIFWCLWIIAVLSRFIVLSLFPRLLIR
jgi:cellulose synthase (UDP-forming)